MADCVSSIKNGCFFCSDEFFSANFRVLDVYFCIDLNLLTLSWWRHGLQIASFHAELRICECHRFLMICYTYSWHSINPEVPTGTITSGNGRLYCPFVSRTYSCKNSVCSRNSPQPCLDSPKSEWHDGQRHINEAGKCIRENTALRTKFRGGVRVQACHAAVWIEFAFLPLRRDYHSGSH